MPQLARPAALLDLDGTLHEGTLGASVLRELARTGSVSGGETAAALTAIARRADAGASFATTAETVYAHYTAAVRGLPHHTLVEAAQRAWEHHRHTLFGFVRPLLAELSSRGYIPVLISGSPHEAVVAAAADLGITHCFGARVSVTAGHCQGHLRRAPGLPGEKVRALMELAGRHPIDLRRSLALGDSASDIDLFKSVGHPLVFEPDDELAAAAHLHGWARTDRDTVLDACTSLLAPSRGRAGSGGLTDPRAGLPVQPLVPGA